MPPQRKKKSTKPSRSPNEIRGLLLQYFYDRNRNATSARGKLGFAVKINDVRREAKARDGLSREDVIGNLNYLMSQGWIEEEQIQKSFSTPTGTVVPSVTPYYKITAAGIDKIEGPGEYTMDKFRGIRIEASGQSIVTVGDGNQVNAQFEGAAGALVELKDALLRSTDLSEKDKMDAISDIDSIESQLAKAEPNSLVIQGAWEGVKKLDLVTGLMEKVGRVASLLVGFLA